MAYSATDWPAYLGLFGQMIAAGGFFLFVLIISWVFGREFADGTLKDMLAVPVPRSSILLAKFIVVAVWSAALTLVIFIAGLLMGALIGLPGGSLERAPAGQRACVLVTACLVIAVVAAVRALRQHGPRLPAADRRGGADADDGQPGGGARAGANTSPGRCRCCMRRARAPCRAVSYWIVLFTGLAGMLATYLWWKYADQNR